MTTRTRRATVLLLLAVVGVVFAGVVALTGGLDTRVAGVPLRARSWERPALLGALFGIAGLFVLRRQVAAMLPGLVGGERGRRVVVLLAVASAGFVGVAFGTYAAGGSDSSGYVSQAQLFAGGRLVDTHPVHPAFTWPNAPATFAPLGYTPGHRPGTLAPTYPPGLPLLMVPLAAIDPRAVFLLGPLSAMIAVWLCWRLGLALREPLAGALGAALLASSPTFLYHAVQPMSDVPVTVCWTAALLLAAARGRWASAAAGLSASIAILIRPNLAPLAIFVVALAATTGPRGVARGVACVIAMAPGLAALGAIQAVRYGSPVASGYGTLEYLFAFENIVPNLGRYTGWLTAMHTPFIWAWLFAPWWFRTAAPGARRFGWMCWGFALAVLAAYLPYAVFNPEEWFYTRFVLPAFPAMFVMGVAVLLSLARRTMRYPAAATVLVAVLLVTAGVTRAASAGVFGLAAAERRYPAVGAYVRDEMPADAAIVADQHSGSIRYYARRPIVRWPLLDPGSLDEAVDGLRRAGYTPYVVLDPFEAPGFRERFGPSSAPLLERFTLIAEIGGTRIYTILPTPGAPDGAQR